MALVTFECRNKDMNHSRRRDSKRNGAVPYTGLEARGLEFMPTSTGKDAA